MLEIIMLYYNIKSIVNKYLVFYIKLLITSDS